MGRYTGPKNKLSRREGADLFNKGQKLRRAEVIPGLHGKKRPGKVSDYGRQLRAKQTFKRIYGIRERQMKNYIVKASKNKQKNLTDSLISLVERRLDNVIYRLGWVPTRAMARQLVTHHHVLVNNKLLYSPSYTMEIDDKTELKVTAQNMPVVIELQKEKNKIPEWLKQNKFEGSVIREPDMEEVTEPIAMKDVIEYYSR